MLAEVDALPARAHGIALVGALGFENAYALAMRARRGAERSASGASATWRRSRRTLTIGGDYEFFGGPSGGRSATPTGCAFADQRSMDSSLMYQAVASGEVDVISAFSTDGRIAALDLCVLEDDRGAIPPYDAVVLASARLAREQPDVVAALRQLAGTIDAERMRAANLAVDEEKRSPAEVARELVAALGAATPDGEATPPAGYRPPA